MEYSDKQLVEQLLLGDERALKSFYSTYKDRLQKYILNKIDNAQDAEEILQDVFMESLDALRNFTFKSSIYTFICSIANHKIIDFYRKQRVKQIVLSKLPEDITPLLSQFLGPEEEFDVQEVKTQIKVVFAKLKPRYAQLLKLKYIEGFSMNEIAEKLVISVKSVESSLFRARISFIKEYRLLYVR